MFIFVKKIIRFITHNTLIMTVTVKTRFQVAAEYGISVRTLRRWLKTSQLNVPAYGALNPVSLALIYKTFGHPDPGEA